MEQGGRVVQTRVGGEGRCSAVAVLATTQAD